MFWSTERTASWVNRRTRPGKSPAVASDTKRAKREKARLNERTFDCRCLRGSRTDSDRTVRLEIPGVAKWSPEAQSSRGLGFLLLVAGCLCRRQIESIRSRTHGEHVALLVADDFHLEAGGPHYRPALVVCAMCGAPFTWPMTAGEEILSPGWASWAAPKDAPSGSSGWTEEIFGQGEREHLCLRGGPWKGDVRRRCSFARASPPCATLPFRGHAPTRVRQEGSSIRLLLLAVPRSKSDSRGHYPCAEELRSAAQAPRVDAQASDERTGKGGWLQFVRDDGTLDKLQSRWFSAEIRKEDWPWIFEKDGRPTSTLEALAVLVGLKLFHGDEPQLHQTQVQVVATWTDNRGNCSVFNKLVTTRFPSSAVVMKLAAFMKKRRLNTTVHWAPPRNEQRSRCASEWCYGRVQPQAGVRPGSRSGRVDDFTGSTADGSRSGACVSRIPSQAVTTRAEARGAQRNGFVSQIRGSVTCGKRVRRTRFVRAPPRTHRQLSSSASIHTLITSGRLIDSVRPLWRCGQGSEQNKVRQFVADASNEGGEGPWQKHWTHPEHMLLAGHQTKRVSTPWQRLWRCTNTATDARASG